ncbi:hypothetical protein N7465_011136 [Penicillium sp. CMV-2018d]|nr:hypothetical protein N7465_011136 [Penicillium sp. CMV-2018d]
MGQLQGRSHRHLHQLELDRASDSVKIDSQFSHRPIVLQRPLFSTIPARNPRQEQAIAFYWAFDQTLELDAIMRQQGQDDASRFHSLTGTHVTQDTRDAYTQWVYNRVSLLAPPVSLPSTALDWEKLAMKFSPPRISDRRGECPQLLTAIAANTMSYLGVIPTSLCEADYEHSMWLRHRANWRARAEAKAPYTPPGSHASVIVPFFTSLELYDHIFVSHSQLVIYI